MYHFMTNEATLTNRKQIRPSRRLRDRSKEESRAEESMEHQERKKKCYEQRFMERNIKR